MCFFETFLKTIRLIIEVRHMKRILSALLVIFMMTAIVACQQQSIDETYDMKGIVEDVRFDSEGAFTNILVKGDLEDENGNPLIDYGWATIDSNTKVYVDGEEVDFYPFIEIEDIIVEVKYDGAVMESYPVQGTAGIVRIYTKQK
jgi:hypothetical protein